MRNRLVRLLVPAIAVGSLVLGITAHAAPATWTVAGTGGKLDGKAGLTTLTNTRNNTKLTCQSSAVNGTTQDGSGQSGDGLAKINNTTWTSCSGPLGITFNVVHKGVWLVNAKSYDGTAITEGTITEATAAITGPNCSGDVAGSAAGTYNNSTAKLTIDPALNAKYSTKILLSNVKGCFGLLASGDEVTFSGVYDITPNTAKLTSP
ncbi:hypothetical protein D5S17_33630 [Pseudonocardiaceae bacterium YIM PH 21723]|nr:hypothetical protein D5S17_33630 [Pseudonocardiaceae bacterium YIM PH 21723]